MRSTADGGHGITLACTHLSDIILMDINLPDISGIEALKILQGDLATKHIPVIGLSADAMPRDIEKALEAGFFRYLTKPIKVGEFVIAREMSLKYARTNTSSIRDVCDG